MLTITISGPAESGKTMIGHALRNALKRAGFCDISFMDEGERATTYDITTFEGLQALDDRLDRRSLKSHPIRILTDVSE